MRKRIEIRVDAGYYELLQRTAALHGVSLAELVRRYVADGLARDAGLLAVAGGIAGDITGGVAGVDKDCYINRGERESETTNAEGIRHEEA